MRRVTIDVASLDQTLTDFNRAWKTGEYQGEFISFDSVETLLKALTVKRWDIVHDLQQEGAMTIRALARRLNRDVKNVHADVQALMEIGLIVKEGRKITVPFDEIRAGFVIKKAA